MSTHKRFGVNSVALRCERLEDRQLLAVTAEAFALGAIDSGIVGPDTFNGSGYILYSEDSVHTRFAGLPQSNSDHLVIARFDEGWLFFDNNDWQPFEPAANDRLLAAVEFQLTTLADQNDPSKIDTVVDLKGTDEIVSGIAAGYQNGNLQFFPDTYGTGAGSFNNGEHKVTGTFFEIEVITDDNAVEPNGAGFSLETIATGLLQPTSFAVSPDGRIFVAEKKGRIKIVENGQVTATFLSITDDVASVGDRGLIGIALDPDFENNGHVYYHYTVLDPDGDGITPDVDGDGRVEGVGGALERVTVSATDPNVADMSTRTTVLDGHRMTASTHSVGDLDFDNDGNLIFTWGDGGFGDIRLEAQDPNSVQGKLFRIDTDTLEGVSSNPFFDAENPDSVASKVWALGIRNSWRLTVDRATGDVYMGEVTDRGPEEINVLRDDGSTLLNFGWPYYEGDNEKAAYQDQIPEGFEYESPFLKLPHLDLGSGDAITGGAIYRGTEYPDVYNGRYFFGSIVPGLFYTADQDGNFQQFGSLGDYAGIGDIQMGPDGHLWMMSLFNGSISRLVFDPTAATVLPPIINATQSTSAGVGSVSVQFDASSSSSISGNAVTFAWDFESDGVVDSTAASPQITFDSLGTFVTSLVVTDDAEATATKSFETTVLESADPLNLAFGKQTIQSPTAFGGVSSRAVDGNTDGVFGNGSTSLTQPTKNAFWEVDLDEVYDITSINLFERSDPTGTQLEDIVVLISELPFTSGNLEAVTTDPGVVSTSIAEVDGTLTIAGDANGVLARGRFVRVQRSGLSQEMSLAEVQVFGNSTAPVNPEHSITQTGDTVIAVASNGDDVVELTLDDTTHVLNISGTEYTFDASIVKTFRIGAGLGTDSVIVHGTSRDERANIVLDDGRLTSDDFDVFTYSFDETHYLGNGGTDYAEIFGSTGDDQLAALPEDATLTTADYVMRASEFDRIDSYGRGGSDYASIYGTQSDDLYFMRDNYALMSGGGVINFTKQFERVDAFGRGGNDRAQLYDSPVFDLFVALPTHAYVTNGQRISYTKGFERVDSFSVEGGDDRVVFYDDAATDDQFTSRADYAFMTNGAYLNYASNYATVDAISRGGNDTASYFEITSADQLFGLHSLLKLEGPDRDESADGFESILAQANEDATPVASIDEVDFALQQVGNWI